jgi:hypothetical protein
MVRSSLIVARYLKAEGVPFDVLKGCVPVDGGTYDLPAMISFRHMPLMLDSFLFELIDKRIGLIAGLPGSIFQRMLPRCAIGTPQEPCGFLVVDNDALLWIVA